MPALYTLPSHALDVRAAASAARVLTKPTRISAVQADNEQKRLLDHGSEHGSEHVQTTQTEEAGGALASEVLHLRTPHSDGSSTTLVHRTSPTPAVPRHSWFERPNDYAWRTATCAVTTHTCGTTTHGWYTSRTSCC